MTNKHRANKFFDRLRRSTVRYGDQQLEMLFRFAEKEGLVDASVTEIHKRFIEANNGFEGNNGVGETLECPYATWCSHDQIDCAKDFEKKSRIHKVTKAFCGRCWEREQKKKLQDRARGVEVQKAQIHRLQQRVNQTIEEQRIREQNDLVICPKTDQVIPSIQCSNCDEDQQKRCKTVMEDSYYQKELAKVRTLI